MNEDIVELLNNAVRNMVENVSSDAKYNKLINKHNAKLHFVPLHYRVIGGQLQSLNIQFGNFLEKFLSEIINSDERYEIVAEYSGIRRRNFQISSENDQLIDDYIRGCQLSQYPDIALEFETLKQQVLINNRRNFDLISFKHDIDILFRNIETGVKYYVEVKYQDDHDSGKFVDINRKFIKTYAYLTKELNIDTPDELVPILFYFNSAQSQTNIYIPEEQTVMRGAKFFETFLPEIPYEDVETLFNETAEQEEIKDLFDELYTNTMLRVDETNANLRDEE